MVSDAANAIRNGFRLVFGTKTNLIMCWFHVKKCATDKFKSILNKQRATEALEDLNALHLAPSNKIFGSAVVLFKSKWKAEKDLLEYLKKMWFNTHKNWFFGSTLGERVPLTNNSLESFNGRLKLQGTQRERMEFGWFLYTMMEKMPLWSTETKYSKVPTIPLSLWKSGLESSKKIQYVDISVNPDVITALFAKNGGLPNNDAINARRTMKWRSFDSYAESVKTIFETTVPKSDWERISSCTCREYILDYICVHIIDLVIRHKLAPVPDLAKPNLLASKPKAGRTKKMTKALVRD